MGIAGMVLGILAIITVWIPLVGIVAIPLVAVGLPMSLAGFRSARRNNDGAGTGMAIAGITLNLVAAAIILLWLVACGALLGRLATLG